MYGIFHGKYFVQYYEMVTGAKIFVKISYIYEIIFV